MANPFPASISAFTVEAPIVIPGPRGMPDVEEVTFEFSSLSSRSYTSGGKTMWAQAYEALVPELSSGVQWGAVCNEASGRVDEATEAIAYALGRYAMSYWSYDRNGLAIPDGLGVVAPLSKQNMAVTDGTIRFRGFCAGLRALDPSEVATVGVEVGELW